MATITTFMICDNIENVPTSGGGAVPRLVAPQVALRPQFVPGNFSFGVAVGVCDVNLHKRIVLQYTITDPKGKLVQDSGPTEFPAIDAPDTMPSEFQGFVMSIDVRNLMITAEGKYLFTLYIDGELIGSHEIPVFMRR